MDSPSPKPENDLDILSGTYFWRDLPGFVTPKIKTTLKLPKGHFRDSGLNLFLQNVHSIRELDVYPRLGNVFESFIVEELIRGIEFTTARNMAHWCRDWPLWRWGVPQRRHASNEGQQTIIALANPIRGSLPGLQRTTFPRISKRRRYPITGLLPGHGRWL